MTDLYLLDGEPICEVCGLWDVPSLPDRHAGHTFKPLTMERLPLQWGYVEDYPGRAEWDLHLHAGGFTNITHEHPGGKTVHQHWELFQLAQEISRGLKT